MKVTNTIKAPVGLPGGFVIPGKQTKDVPDWERVKGDRRTQQLLERGTLVEDAPVVFAPEDDSDDTEEPENSNSFGLFRR